MSEVKTFEDARKLALIKWIDIKDALINLDNLIDDDCSFCEYSNYLHAKEPESQPTKLGSCKHCPVESLCDKLIELKDSRSDFISFIYQLVIDLEDMKEENYQSRHQLEGGE